MLNIITNTIINIIVDFHVDDEKIIQLSQTTVCVFRAYEYALRMYVSYFQINLLNKQRNKMREREKKTNKVNMAPKLST